MNVYFADMHIHIGRDKYGKPVKITGAKSLTLTNILMESSRNKGIDMIGVIDCHAPAVQEEIKSLIDNGEASELPEGGIRFERVTLILGSEIEIYDENCLGPIHVLVYLPTLSSMEAFSKWLSTRMKNITLSSQRYYGSAKQLQYKVKELGGLFIPAHVFTPFKSLYGKGVRCSLGEVLDPDLIDGIELGLSSDTQMADQLSELHRYTFVTNSDAHSLPKIAREYQEVVMQNPTFKEFNWALHRVDGRQIKRNFGMNPLLGKYHTTVCSNCFEQVTTDITKCPKCGSTKIIKGVSDRIEELKNTDKQEVERPDYLYQVPLEYLPTLGPKTFQKLLNAFGTEMEVIHHTPYQNLIEVVPEKLANSIIQMREGKLPIKAGGGGKYGSIGPS
ncbi:endonuclease Q family protein [Oceanobacillus profundus]|uniref:endonuclease Q family protein n=1 Tax=Oceanobacillus TaxID=182709 RepID=UPI00203F7395|nr:endonuclease Q family protein [Oceanobacillus profundus]MCM3396562.1 endonuclease Q family protein [Oceanobacillus profundus]MDO6451095.1 endonuclease Q family protein [Oceanobacillus profundus]